MNLTRFEPWSIADFLHRDLDRLFERRFGQAGDNGNTIYDWVPAVDIVEEKDQFVVRADVPGVEPEDIELNMDNGVLTVSGERKLENVTEQEGFRRIERASGRFLRRFTLPDTADAENIKAKSKNGILEVSIPKLPEVQARRITVEAN